MPASLEFEDYVDALYAAAERLSEHSLDIYDHDVPTCPEWNVRQLLAHTGMVHRWAAGIVRGQLDARTAAEATDGFEVDGMLVDDTGGWLLAGAGDLADALEEAPIDLERFFFLNDAPPARLAWARRQCHETTIHAVDGLSAQMGRVPDADRTDIDADLAADGIDEVLRGFATREREELRTSSGETVSVVIEATDIGRSWTLRLSGEPAVCDEGATEDEPDARLRGTATQLYLGLWNRGDEIQQEGVDVLTFWREHLRIEW
ncbi:MAG TPA: maleylpyruvate isomerase family mycothiol-dependent enzyme [Flexivirga sp.]|uniref:maleylpyruvate isomerase family mycothiol-dependent enzyme n=1 Tax=Flexivirga sp. TaxID=1962927 RepID=UPI002C87EEEE|nr:maleylpyruvate isomerase family mycothiol-dependent enzyme [Flexivirga sp.]HWC23117.1 maleylpyruvate isomerase family mycothiol-dependent enzyme [Flexivirga sp.]